MDNNIIYRQDAINELTENKEMINAVLDSLTLDYNTRRDQEQRRGQIIEDIETIKTLPSAQLEQQWTSCSERPPEEESEVLVTTSWNDVCKAWYSNGKWRAEFINEYDDDEILAWMPLPEPYQKQGDQNGKN